MSAGNHTPPECVKAVKQALSRNPDCELGLLHQYGFVYTRHGECSFNNQQELLVLLTPIRAASEAQNNWYGHVFCTETKLREQKWVAILVQSAAYVDSDNIQAIFRAFKRRIEQNSEWEPPFIQQDGDVCSLHDSFDEAVDGLADKIDRFSFALRQHDHSEYVTVDTGYEVVDMVSPKWPENSFPDMSYMNVYGFGFNSKCGAPGESTCGATKKT